MFSPVDEARLAHEACGVGIRRFVVGAVVCREDTVLILKRRAGDFMGGIYELPSGKVESGEGLVAALQREVKEEVGYDVVVKRFIDFFDYKSGSGQTTRQFNFEVMGSFGEVRLSDEHEDFVWVKPGDLKRFNITDPVVSTIMKIFREADCIHLNE